MVSAAACKGSAATHASPNARAASLLRPHGWTPLPRRPAAAGLVTVTVRCAAWSPPLPAHAQAFDPLRRQDERAYLAGASIGAEQVRARLKAIQAYKAQSKRQELRRLDSTRAPMHSRRCCARGTAAQHALAMWQPTRSRCLRRRPLLTRGTAAQEHITNHAQRLQALQLPGGAAALELTDAAGAPRGRVQLRAELLPPAAPRHSVSPLLAGEPERPSSPFADPM